MAPDFQNRWHWFWHRSGKTSGTGFTKPVAPVSACGAQLGAQRPERKKGGLGKVEGDAVMLTPCLVCMAKAGE